MRPFLVLLPLFFCVLAHPLLAVDWEGLQERLQIRYLASPDPGTLQDALANLQPSGNYGDLDYAADRPLEAYTEHLDRVTALLAAYHTEGHALHADPETLSRIISSLDWWLREDYRDTNWWHTYIGYPKRLAQVTPLVADALRDDHPEVYARLIAYHQRVHEYLKVSPMGGGANLADMGYYSVIGAIMDEDEAWVEALITESFEPSIAIIGKASQYEGWQVDASMQAHGPQLHNATYGSELMNSATRTVHLFHGTSWDLGQDKVELLQWQLLEGVRHMSYGDWFDYNAAGRGVSRPKSDILARRFADFIPLVLEMNPSKPDELVALRQRILRDGPHEGNTFRGMRSFYRSDFITRIRPHSYSSVRMVSERTKRNETGNNEGIRNRYFGDGVQLNLVHGDEYDLAPVLWNYNRIPGITARQTDNLRPNTIWGEAGRAAYAGSLTDGAQGMAAMRLDYDGLSGWKSWFLTPHGILALGSDLTIPYASLQGEVHTAINQTLAEGPLEQGGTADQATWLWHRDIGYYLYPDNDPAVFTVESRSGDWADVGVSEGPVSGDMLELYLNHGNLPENKGYAYLVRPDVTLGAWQDSVADIPLQILSRNSDVHAVRETLTGDLYAAFFTAGTLELGDGQSLTVDQPALVMITDRLGTRSVRVADPLQSATEIVIELKGWQLEGEDAVRLGDAHYRITLPMPQDDFTGSAALLEFAIPGQDPFDPGPTLDLGQGWHETGAGRLFQWARPDWIFDPEEGWLHARSDHPYAQYFYNPASDTWTWFSASAPAWHYDFQTLNWEERS